jgi:uncharacterized protein YecE (DUF72 family)
MGGWSYEPWRDTFYPSNIRPAQELEYASRQVTAIEINSTFYRLQKPAVFAKWRDTTPDDFVFTLKAPRFVTHRKRLADAGPGVQRFIDSGIAELDGKLGAILWQLAAAHPFDHDDMVAFLEYLPNRLGKQSLRHAINVRHASFQNPRFIELARRSNIAVVFEDDAAYPAIADVTADFVYARLRRSEASNPAGYTKEALKRWAMVAEQWASGERPERFEYHSDVSASSEPRDVFVFFINGVKERAPAAAKALIEHL